MYVQYLVSHDDGHDVWVSYFDSETAARSYAAGLIGAWVYGVTADGTHVLL